MRATSVELVPSRSAACRRHPWAAQALMSACAAAFLATAFSADAVTLTGRVLTSRGAPVAGAEIAVVTANESDDPATGTTDARGEFALDAALRDDATFGLVVRAAGRPAIAFRTTYTAAPGQGARAVELVLPAPVTVAGIVTDATGAARAGVRITATADSPWHACDAEAVSDDSGRFAFKGLPAGSTAELSVEQDGLHGYVAVRVPESGGADGSLRLSSSPLHPREESRAGEPVPRAAQRIFGTWATRIRGRVVDDSGAGAGGAAVTIFGRRDGRQAVISDAAGNVAGTEGPAMHALAALPGRACLAAIVNDEFECRLVPAATIHFAGRRSAPIVLTSEERPEVVVRFDHPLVSRAEIPAGTWRVAEIGSGREPRVVRALAGKRVRVNLRNPEDPTAVVQVSDERGEPLAGASVFLPSINEPGVLATWTTAPTDADGIAEIDGSLVGARTMLRVEMPGRPVVEHDAVLRGTVDVVVPPAASIRGDVRSRDGVALAGAHVRLMPASLSVPSMSAGDVTTDTDARGEFQFAAAAGAFVLEVVSRGGARHVEPAWLTAGATLERHLVLDDDAAAAGGAPRSPAAVRAPEAGVPPAPRPARTVSGTVVDESGRPVVGALISGCTFRATTRFDGSFACFVSAGVTSLRITLGGDKPEAADIEAPDSGHRQVDVRLHRTGVGKVRIHVDGVPPGTGTRVLLTPPGSQPEFLGSDWDVVGLMLRGVSELGSDRVPAGTYDLHVGDLAGHSLRHAGTIVVQADDTARATVSWSAP